VDDGTSDQQLLERVGFGDTTAFWELWLRHEIYVRQICRRMGGTEDDVHDVMLKLVVKLPVYAAKISNLRAWMGKWRKISVSTSTEQSAMGWTF